MRASANGHVEAVRLLLDRGADVNAKDKVSTCDCTVLMSMCLLSVCLYVSCVVGIYAFQYVLLVVLSLPLY